MSELLLEILSEEIPARMQARAADDLKRLVSEKLAAAGLSFKDARAFVTPRRLALVVDGLPERQPDQKHEEKGPKVGSPDQAIQGFLRKIGRQNLDECEKRLVGKAETWFFVTLVAGQTAERVIADVVSEAVDKFAWPKSMRWGEVRERWVRPLHSVLCIFNGRVVAGSIGADADEIQFGDTTVGHRFMAPARFAVTGFADYAAKLKAAKVLLDPAERRAKIAADATAAATKLGVKLRDDPGLLDEVTGLVEWPVVYAGAIDEKFMDVPAEVLVTSMRAHQKYFATLGADGSLARHFVVVANMETTDGGKMVVAGNERVLRARLSDAKFFWDQDRKIRLEARLPALAQRVFHAKLGTMAEKVARLEALAEVIAPSVGASMADAVRAAKLAKADLSSGMVGEFPELQGVMGRYYARHDGESETVAAAIRAHYQPLGPGDECPSAPVSVTVALAEKIDTLAGFWKIDEKPTGSKDPFALRRAALGVIRLIVENGLRVKLLPVFAKALSFHGSDKEAALAGDLLGFFADRLKVTLKEKGVRHDLIDAVFALGNEDDLVRLLARVDALAAFLKTDDGANLQAAAKRASNILAIETKKDGHSFDEMPDDKRLDQAEEKALAGRLSDVEKAAGAALAKEDFAAAMVALASLRAPVDAFFDKVTVNADDRELRANRLRLLSLIRRTLAQVADFARIEG